MADTQEPGPEPRKTPIENPLPDSLPIPRPDLTADQQAKYEALLAQARAFTDVTCKDPKDKDQPNPSGPLTDSERLWLTRECLLRYLRATRWVVDEASRRLLATLAWRREYGLEGFTAEYISPEQETGKQMIVGFDRQGRPCQYLNPNRQNTDASPRQIHHLFYMVERVVEVMPPGVETLSLLINFKPSKQRQNTSVPVATAREVLSVLQNHYPERLGKALIINGKPYPLFFFTFFDILFVDGTWKHINVSSVPWVVWGFFKIITPFIDPVTRDKLKFNEDMKQYVDPSQLWSADWGGDMDFEYDHAAYWPALDELCRRRRAERVRRWEAGGKLVGESEAYLSGGSEVGVGGRRDGGVDADAVGEKLAAVKLEEEEKEGVAKSG